MSKIIVLQMRDRLPKERSLAFNYHRNKCFLCQTFHFSPQLRRITEQKIKTLQLLSSNLLTKIEAVIKQDRQIHIIYQCVHNKLSCVIKNGSMLFINGVYAQLKLLQHELTNFGIAINFNLHRFGIDETGNIKYFTDLDFEFGCKASKSELENFYNRQIYSILTYFCQNNTQITEEDRIEIFKKIPTHPALENAAAQQKVSSQFFKKLSNQQIAHSSLTSFQDIQQNNCEESFNRNQSLYSYQEPSVLQALKEMDDNFELQILQEHKNGVGFSELSAWQIQELVRKQIDRTKKVAQALHNLYKIKQ